MIFNNINVLGNLANYSFIKHKPRSGVPSLGECPNQLPYGSEFTDSVSGVIELQIILCKRDNGFQKRRLGISQSVVVKRHLV